jgi:hypothetical protein
VRLLSAEELALKLEAQRRGISIPSPFLAGVQSIIGNSW